MAASTNSQDRQETICRSKKRDTELASLGEQPTNLKKPRSGSVDNLRDTIAQQDADCDDEDQVFTAESTASESESEDVGKVSKVQKIFAKRSIKREKKKEKEHKKKVEKNHISMDDFLSKQSEFKMWLHEEKNKTAGDLSSPKLKSLFKQFVQAWNKKKLPQKYFKSSEASPLTRKKQNFLLGDGSSSGPLQCESEVDNSRETPSSPFITFGKTPPKVFKSKRLQLFGNKPDIALISVAAIGSRNLPEKTSNKENELTQEEPSHYQTPTIQPGATPYKVSVFPWAVADTSGNQSLEICSTATPPNTSLNLESEEWPPPPTEEEIQNPSNPTNTMRARTKDSPHVPPPPPPRSESLTPGNKRHIQSPLVPDGYADPYDKLKSSSKLKGNPVPDYQEPVDTVIRINSRNQPENPRLVLQSFSQNEEPDTSLYSKPIHNEGWSHSRSYSADSNLLSSSNDNVPDVVLCSQPARNVNPRSENIEELYAKPMKKRQKQEDSKDIDTNNKSNENTNDKGMNKNDIPGTTESYHGNKGLESELYSEIMAHLEKKPVDLNVKSFHKPDPIYETIDDCQEKLYSESQTKLEFGTFQLPGQTLTDESSLTKIKKKTILAASSDKIYETYLSLKGNPYVFKQKPKKDEIASSHMNTLNKKFKSQPDISFTENSLKEFDGEVGSDDEDRNKKAKDGAHLTVAQRATSLENGLKGGECPGTPIITATPSFDSLCAVTPLSKMSGSSQSLPTKTGSYESLTSESNMSVSSRSTLSTVPDEDESKLSEMFEDENTPTVPAIINSPESVKEDKRYLSHGDRNFDDDAKNKKLENGSTAVTPGKISAAKHGIDLSVYILKPTKQEEIKAEAKPSTDGEFVSAKNKGLAEAVESNIRNDSESGLAQKLFDTQARLAIKDTFSSGKSKTESTRPTGKKETERKHTLQTAHGLNSDSPQESVGHSAVPSIGVTLKARKAECGGKSGKSRPIQESWTEPAESKIEPDSKRLCTGTKVMGHGKDLYLETDLDRVIVDKGKTNLKKSKSHGSIEQSSSTIMTDIW